MSHVTTVSLKIRDLDALDEACEQLGLTLNRGKKTWRWYGSWQNDFAGQQAAASQGFDPKQFGRGEHSISVKNSGANAYEIGVLKARDGDGYELLYDSWGSGGRAIEAVAGPQLPKLKQEYAISAATRKATETLGKKGFKATRETLSTGAVRLKLRRR